MTWIPYHTPSPNSVKFNRLIFGVLMIAAVLLQCIELVYTYLALNILTLVTTVYYGPTQWIDSLLRLIVSRTICSVSPAYERSYYMNKESERFELIARIMVSTIAIMFYKEYPLVTWLIGTFMGVFMMISTFFGVCLSALGYIGWKTFRPELGASCDINEVKITNQNCILARNGFKPYARCDHCQLKAHQCGGMQFNGFVFSIGFLVALFLFIKDPSWMDINVVAIIGLVFWLAHKVTLNIDQLATADFENRQLNEALQEHKASLELDVQRRTEDLERLVKLDSITGLVNRYEFEQRLKAIMDDAKENGTHHVMCYMDLDQFKIVNDKCGHIAGDELLRQLALVLKRSTRENDIVARLGGDEFGIIYTYASLEEAQNQAKRLLDSIGEYRFSWNGNIFGIGASIGMVAISRESNNTIELLSQADAACYAAKDEGRNRIHLALPKDSAIEDRRNQMQWIIRLEEALAENSFVLYVQPIAPVLDPLQRSHYEILIRLKEKNGEIIPPMAFIPAAERFGFMPKLDRWVIENTFKTFDRIRSLKMEEIHFSINISGASLGNAGTREFIRSMFADYGVPYRVVTFEITETEAIGNLSNALAFIEEFKKMGCRFSLDDFGCGLSSFSYLQNIPVDFLKIDGSFVHNIHLNPVNKAMVESINNIGHVMGIQTICEFVENIAVLHVLNELEVDYAQGYHIGRPFPIEELLK